MVVRYVMALSDDPDLFANVRISLRTDSRFLDAGYSLHCDGSGADVGRFIAGSTREQVWIVDSKDVVWPAGGVDPERLAHA